MRGWKRLQVAATLLVAAGASGAVVGFAAGVAAGLVGLARLDPAHAVAGVMAAALLDQVASPPSIRRQVPQAWGRLFGPGTAALLYGSRLGPGPLTVLNTWLWWAAFAIGATSGPWGGALVSGAFGLGRVVAMLVVGTRAGRLHGGDRWARLAVGAAAIVLAVAVTAGLADASSGAASGDARIPAAGSFSDRDAGPRSTLPAAEVAPEVTSELAGLLPADAAPGFVRLSDDPAKGLGPIDLEVAASLERDAMAERSLLQTRRFEAGHARGWRHPDGRTAYAVVYRFPTSAEAEAYRRDGSIILDGRGVKQSPLEHPPGAVAFRQALEGGGGSRVAEAVVLVRDRYFVLIIVSGPSSPSDARSAESLAVTVSELLERAPPGLDR